MLQQEHPCQADGKSLPEGCSSTGMREQLQEDMGRWKVNKDAPFPFIPIKCSPHAKQSFTRHTASTQWGEGSPWPTEGPAGLNLRDTRASLHPSAVECAGPSKTRRGSRSPALPQLSTRVTAAAGLPGGCIQLHTPRHPALASAHREVCQGGGSWQKPVNPSAQTSRDPAVPLPALMVGQIKGSALQVAHKKRLKHHSQWDSFLLFAHSGRTISPPD